MEIFTPENLAALVSLTGLEIVLGFDNLVMLSILVAKLPPDKQAVARNLGIVLAMVMRIGLLMSISWIMLLTEPIFSSASIRSRVKAGAFPWRTVSEFGKATFEIHENTEGTPHEVDAVKKQSGKFWAVIAQIVIMDAVFSLDSVITAVGMASHIPVMIVAIVTSMALMLIFAKSVGKFIEDHPTFKILALSFLVLVGVMLVSESLGKHIEKGYIYFAMSFSLLVEFCNLRMRNKSKKAAHPIGFSE